MHRWQRLAKASQETRGAGGSAGIQADGGEPGAGDNAELSSADAAMLRAARASDAQIGMQVEQGVTPLFRMEQNPQGYAPLPPADPQQTPQVVELAAGDSDSGAGGSARTSEAGDPVSESLELQHSELSQLLTRTVAWKNEILDNAAIQLRAACRCHQARTATSLCQQPV